MRDRVDPAPGQESVWDYPRPPRVEACKERVRVGHAGIVLADSVAALRVLETSHPPAIYIPRADVRVDLLRPSASSTWCEFKGRASYWTLTVGPVSDVAWSYPEPTEPYSRLTDHLSFYPGRVDACWLDDEKVTAQSGDFYGGWITSRVVGPFKGAPGTRGW